MRVALSSFLAAVLCAGPAQAAVTVSPPKVRFPAVAANQRGRVVVAWERLVRGRFVVEARIGNGPHSLGPIQRLSRGRAGYAPKVAVAADGTAAVLWHGPGRGRVHVVRATVAAPGRRLGAARVVDERTADVSTVGVAIQRPGRVVAVYRPTRNSLDAAIARPGRGFVRSVPALRLGSLPFASVAADPRDGTVLVGYATPFGPPPVSAAGRAESQAAVVELRPGAATFGAPIVLSGRDGEEAPVEQRIAAGPGGVALVYASRDDHGLVRVTHRRADGTWTPALTAVAPAVEGGSRFLEDPTIALPSDGALVAAWADARYRPSDSDLLLSRRRTVALAPPGGGFGEPLSSLPTAGTVTALDAAADGAGSAYVAWATGAGGPVRIMRRVAGATGFGRDRLLTRSGDCDVLLAGAGHRTLAAWQEGDRLRLTSLPGGG